MNNSDPFSLIDKKILITGASSGIGRTIAIECAKRGAIVLGLGRNLQNLQVVENEATKVWGGVFYKYQIDLLDFNQIEILLSNIDKLNGLVLCAGVSKIFPISFTTDNKIRNLFDLNFNANVQLVSKLIKKKLMTTNSSIVAISSIASQNVISSGYSIYGASKAALTEWMKYLAVELSQKYIRANTISPGGIKTEMALNNLISEDQLEMDKNRYLFKDYGDPLDVALGCVYLLSDASKFVTGINLVIDGGRSLS